MMLPAPLDALSDDDRGALLDHLEPTSFRAGTCIFSPGAPADAAYLLDSGEVRLEVPRPELDADAVLGYLGAGSILGELGLLDHKPRSAAAYADTAVTARRLASATLDRLRDEHPRLAASVLAALGQHAARKLRASNEVLVEHLSADARDPLVDGMVDRARAAQRVFREWGEARVDALLRDIAESVAARAEQLAKQVVEETRLGDVADKTEQHGLASVGVYRTLVGVPGRGALGEPSPRGVVDVAGPVGVVFAVVPVTSPVATAVFETLVALKGRNALIVSFHRMCLGVGNATGEVVKAALARHDAPEHLVQWARAGGDRARTTRLMAHEGVALVLAAGEADPSLPAGRGSRPEAATTPVWVAADADVELAATSVVRSKSFDHGLVAGAEDNLVVDAAVWEAFAAALEARGAAVLSPGEARAFTAAAFAEDGRTLRPRVLGTSAALIAAGLGIQGARQPLRLLVVPAGAEEFNGPLGRAKPAPVLSAFAASGPEEAFGLCRRLLGTRSGATAVVHATDQTLVQRFGVEVPADRILVNGPAVQGLYGLTSGFQPSFALGVGAVARRPAAMHVDYRHLRRVQHLAYPRHPGE